jgi:hypothetical protein
VPSDYSFLNPHAETKMGRDKARPSLGKPVQMPFVRPILRPFDKSSAHRIKSDIGPFFVIMIILTNLCVPIATLPDRLMSPVRPAPCAYRFPVGDPRFQRVTTAWSTKEMHVVRHQQVATDNPSACILPGQSQEFMDFRRGQDGFLGLGANRQENDLSVIVLTKRQR